MDGQLARRDPLFADLLDKFVCVRLVQCYGLDRKLFQFDSNLTMAIFFMNADGKLYGRFGTRASHDDGEYVDPKGLRASMVGALGLHSAVRSGLSNPRTLLADKQRLDSPWDRFEHLPAMKDRVAPVSRDKHKCYHCHWIQGGEILSRRSEGLPVEDRHLWSYPLLDTLGASLDPATKATVARVDPDSPAAEAGLQPGDEITAMEGQPILSIADVQWVLHHAKDGTTISLTAHRPTAPTPRRLEVSLPSGWRRKGDISWRAIKWMLRDEVLGFQMEPLGERQKRKHRLPTDRPAYVVSRLMPAWYKEANHAPEKAGLRKGDIVVAINGSPPPDSMSRLLAWIAQETRPGDRTELRVIRDGKRKTIVFRLK